MSDELNKILEEEEKETPPTPSPEEEKAKNEVLKKEEELSNLNKAILEAQTKLKEVRALKKGTKEEEDLPKIDMTDPSAQAWDRHIKDNVNPVTAEIEKGKEERRNYALSQFLKDKPALAKHPEKVKELVETYEKIRTASEMTAEGIALDLDKAYGAVFHEELIDMARNKRVEDAQANAIFSDIAVSRGSTAYQTEKEKSPVLDEESKSILAKWGMTPEQWAADYKKYK